jgi:hypothetical protein
MSNTCVDRVVPPERVFEAAAKAIDENPSNAPIVNPRPELGVAPHEPIRVALETGKRWKNGRTLRVAFLDGEEPVKQKVRQRAAEWCQYANLKFEFAPGREGEIRISFKEKGSSWSYIGTDALTVPAGEPTMNYGWLTPDTQDDEYSRVVLHEFGHALGCIHEHQNPTVEIPWDKEAVYRYYAGPPNRWSRSVVDHNLFEKYSRESTQFSQFDPHSIMLYAVSNDLTVGDWEVGWNTTLSPTDKEFIGTQYPFDQRPEVLLTIGAAPTKAAIGKHGEEDLYRFEVQQQGSCTVETKGRTDVVMGVFGPNDQTRLAAQDDDSGEGRNAKISTVLASGTYTVKVRHFRPRGTGQYRIAVRSV